MLISVVIPTFNRGHLIKKCIESVLAQTYKNIEVIIVDDGSTDNTEEVVRGIEDSRVMYVYQDNQGACVARNKGIAVAKGAYIAFQDSDDEWMPEKLKKQSMILDTHPDIDIVCCKTRCKKLDGTEFVSLKNRDEGIINNDIGPYGISTQTLLVRRNVFDHVLFDPNVTRYQDLDFLLCATKNHKLYCVSECLVLRYHENDSISSHPERILSMATYFQDKHADIINDKKQFLSYFLASMLIEVANSTDRREDYINKALEINKSAKIFIKIFICNVKSLIKRQ